MKKAIIYQKEECVIIRNINLSDKVFAFFVAVSSKKIIYLKENIYNGNVTYAALDKMIQSLREYQVPAIFNTKILLDTFVNTINYKIRHGYITDSDEILEMILQFEKIVKDPYILQMTAPNVNQIFSREAMYEVTNTIKKIDGKVKKIKSDGKELEYDPNYLQLKFNYTNTLKCTNGHEFCSCGRPLHEGDCYKEDKAFKELIQIHFIE